jgi:hypothetical protein
MMVTINVDAKRFDSAQFHDDSPVPALECWFDDTVLFTIQGSQARVLQVLNEMISEVEGFEADKDKLARDEKLFKEGWKA